MLEVTVRRGRQYAEDEPIHEVRVVWSDSLSSSDRAFVRRVEKLVREYTTNEGS